MPEIINPKTLSLENSKKLYAFFDEQFKKGIHVWSDRDIYSFADGSCFTFSSKVIMRMPKNKGLTLELK
ncbi:MAG: hypothetical protein LEGION0403_FIIPPAGN_00521 [Legionella sp.]|uniref:hypothetical protein n=1 Tax=Legionella sp. TaxID=459 RepID=UPI003D0CEE25